ncbi:MAG: hypothetical protein JNM79_03950 [Burkholderiales bacterium]|nr:hypothetical protein [Burkholderiales bacterium]
MLRDSRSPDQGEGGASPDFVGLPRDPREGQCARAADYMAAHPGCTLRELAEGADLGSASKVVSEMRRRYGYAVRCERKRRACRDGEHSRREACYWLEGRPVRPQMELWA